MVSVLLVGISFYNNQAEKKVKKQPRLTKKENINFLLENWDILDIKDIKRIYLKGVVN